MRLTSNAALSLALCLGAATACDARDHASNPQGTTTAKGADETALRAPASAQTPPATSEPARAASAEAPAAEVRVPDSEAATAARKAAVLALLPSTHPLAGFALLPRDAGKWQALLAQVPELSAYAAGLTPFSGRDADAALTRGQRSRATITVWTIADAPFVWRPNPERELWVGAGSSGEQSLVFVLERKGDDVVHAASTVIAEKGTSVALGYNVADPAELLWTSCYACPGQGGSIRVGDDGRPRFVYR